jgi:hypothetical protein
MKNKFLWLLIVVVYISCTKKTPDEFRDSSLDAPIIDSYIARDEYGMTMGIFGNSTPNVRFFNGTDFISSQYSFIAAPNPIHSNSNHSWLSVCNVYMFSPEGTNKKIWIVRANAPAGNQYHDAGLLVAGGMPVFKHETFSNFLSIGFNKIRANISPGFYRIYVRMGNELLYDNLLIL